MNKNSAWQIVESREYRLSKHTMELGVFSASLFSLAGIVSIFGALSNSDGSFRHPIAAAGVFGGIWFLMALIGCWLILAYRRHRLVVSPEIIRVVDCFNTQEVALAAVSRAIWKLTQVAGSLVLYEHDNRVKISFANYTYQERAELIQFFRAVLMENVQEGWERFESNCTPPHVDFKEVKTRIRRLMRFTIIAWAVALPFLYAILIWTKLSGGMPNGNWGVVMLMPLILVGATVGLLWFASRGDLAKAKDREEGNPN